MKVLPADVRPLLSATLATANDKQSLVLQQCIALIRFWKTTDYVSIEALNPTQSHTALTLETAES